MHVLKKLFLFFNSFFSPKWAAPSTGNEFFNFFRFVVCSLVFSHTHCIWWWHCSTQVVWNDDNDLYIFNCPFFCFVFKKKKEGTPSAAKVEPLKTKKKRNNTCWTWRKQQKTREKKKRTKNLSSPPNTIIGFNGFGNGVCVLMAQNSVLCPLSRRLLIALLHLVLFEAVLRWGCRRPPDCLTQTHTQQRERERPWTPAGNGLFFFFLSFSLLRLFVRSFVFSPLLFLSLILCQCKNDGTNQSTADLSSGSSVSVVLPSELHCCYQPSRAFKFHATATRSSKGASYSSSSSFWILTFERAAESRPSSDASVFLFVCASLVCVYRRRVLTLADLFLPTAPPETTYN